MADSPVISRLKKNLFNEIIGAVEENLTKLMSKWNIEDLHDLIDLVDIATDEEHDTTERNAAFSVILEMLDPLQQGYTLQDCIPVHPDEDEDVSNI